jgi:SagB-type dehydrogenase family enzyme
LDTLDYHQLSKHHLQRYAPGPGHLDWANQPDPFRTYDGAPRTQLPLLADRLATPYGDLRAGRLPPPAAFDLDSVAVLFELALGLSAWKQVGSSRWALRCNPSSGNLHPSEGYLLAPALPGLAAGVHHYVSRDHCLEHRAGISDPRWNDAFAGGGILVGVTSIFWREAWKYGLRAFRYCQHDVGHAIAAIAYAAAALGWRARRLAAIGDDALAALLGVDRNEDFAAAEREAPDCLIWIGADAVVPDPAPLLEYAATALWQGRANRLSPDHRDWPDIDRVHAACHKPDTSESVPGRPALLPPPAAAAHNFPAARIIRQRRSAMAFDGKTEIGAEAFFALLDATLPRSEAPPWNAWNEPAAVHLALFVHRVNGLEPGLYLLLRDAADRDELRAALRDDWLWRKVGPEHLPLYLLLPHDLREAARTISCHQDIAADSCFSLGMLARMSDIKREPWRYRLRYWECGMIGQTLYLEAEAAGVRGTGIGCFFDDEMHRLLGLRDRNWQSLYHFTVGGAVDDPRLTTLPPYAGPRHVEDARNGG